MELGLATAVVEDSLSAQLQTQPDRSSSCLLVSQQGPFAGRLFTVLPVSPQLSVPSHLFRTLSDSPFPSPIALAGAVAASTPFWRPPRSVRPGWVVDMNLPVERLDDRRLEVVANGLLFWNGAQVAVDTTLVSPLSSSGRVAGAALGEARRRKERTYPELLRYQRCRLVVLAIEVGGRWSAQLPPQPRSCASSLHAGPPSAFSRLRFRCPLVRLARV